MLDFKVGDRVQLLGLKTEGFTDMNGQCGVIKHLGKAPDYGSRIMPTAKLLLDNGKPFMTTTNHLCRTQI